MKILNSDSLNPTNNKSPSLLRPQLKNRRRTHTSSVTTITTTIIMTEKVATVIDNKNLTAKTVVTEGTAIKTEAPITNMAIEMRKVETPTKKVATDKTVVTGKINKRAVKEVTTKKIETPTTKAIDSPVSTKNASINLKSTPTQTTGNSTAMTPTSS